MEHPPHTAETLALARATLTDTALMQLLTPDQQREIVEAAQAILRRDLAWRKRMAAAAQADSHGALVIVPMALWQAGLRARRIPRVARPIHPTTPTPGDAA